MMQKFKNFGWFLTFCVITLLYESKVSSTRVRRGFGSYSDSLVYPRQRAFDELNSYQNVALWSAQSAVTSSVGQVYGHQQATLANQVRQFTAPLYKNRSKAYGRHKQHQRTHYNDNDGPEDHHREGHAPQSHHPEHAKTSRDNNDERSHPKEVSRRSQGWVGRNGPSRREAHRSTSLSRKQENRPRLQEK